jgi:hypothetical protein
MPIIHLTKSLPGNIQNPPLESDALFFDQLDGKLYKKDYLGNVSLAVVSGGGGGVTLLNKSVTLTSSQILNLSTNPVELIPAPGIGKYIYLINYYWKINFLNLPYLSSGGFIGTKYVGGNLMNFIELVAYSTSSWGSTLAGYSNFGVDIENNALIISSSSPFTQGSGSVKLTVTYTINDV